MAELKSATSRRDDDGRRVNDEIRGIKDLVQRSLAAQKESADTRLTELNNELKGLKTLVGSRMSSTPRPISGDQHHNGFLYDAVSGKESKNHADASTMASANGEKEGDGASQGSPRGSENSPASSSSGAGEGRDGKDVSRITRSGFPVNRAAIPAWQMAATNKDKGGGDKSKAESQVE